jgi:hypothetical protein
MDEFYAQQVEGTDGDIGRERCREVCSGPWAYLKQQMENGHLPTIRFKYFGTFVVYPKRAIMLLKKLRDRYKQQKDAPERFLKKESMIKEFLDNAGDS